MYSKPFLEHEGNELSSGKLSGNCQTDEPVLRDCPQEHSRNFLNWAPYERLSSGQQVKGEMFILNKSIEQRLNLSRS